MYDILSEGIHTTETTELDDSAVTEVDGAADALGRLCGCAGEREGGDDERGEGNESVRRVLHGVPLCVR